MDRVRLIVMNAALGPLDYRPPKGQKSPPPGSIVLAPLGPRQIVGIVWETERLPTTEVPESKLRPLLNIPDLPPVPASLRRLIEWTADYYCAPIASVARMALSSRAALSGPSMVSEYRLTGQMPERMTSQRELVFERLADEQATVRELAEAAGVSEGVIRGLIQQGCFQQVLVDTDRPYPPADPDFAPAVLSADQQAAADAVSETVVAQRFQTYLLDGVTGSGKTETYFETVATALRQERQVLVLLPEIALTQPFLSRFEARFGVAPIPWHSSLGQTQRRRAWRAAISGTPHVFVGARSSLFLPFPNLGLVIVDEAHEVSFKQDDGVRYNARDVAVMRGAFTKVPVILASATPALESRHMADIGRYQTLKLPSRHGNAQMPDVQSVDLREDAPPRGRWISPKLEAAVRHRLTLGEQSLLFLNRRGYAPLTLCRHCGHRFQCPNCTAWMVEHRLLAKLACHHCGLKETVSDRCPECGADDCLVACGPGVERIAEEAADLFPDARTAIATSDTIWSPEKAAEFVKMVEQGTIDIIIGTQLVTKGYHFPELTLVGVIDADIGLEGGDLRAAERSFQQIAQVAGRAGRAAKAGEVLVQTRFPDNPVIAAIVANDRNRFYDEELASRERAGLPPFGRMAAIIISSEDEAEARDAARYIGSTRPEASGITIFGPAPAPLSMLRGRYRHRLLIQAHRQAELQTAIRNWLEPLELPRSVRVSIDVDPYSFV